jgi:hypothetical protein
MFNKLKMSKKTMIKVAIAILIVCLVWLISKWRGRCQCDSKKKSKVSYGTLKPMPQEITMTAVPEEQVYFDEYDPETEDMTEDDIITQKEMFADYVPDYSEGKREMFVDSKDMFSHPEFSGMII